MPRDAEQPRSLGTTVRVIAVVMQPGPHEGLLHDLLGRARIAHSSSHPTQECATVTVGDVADGGLGRRRRVAAANAVTCGHRRRPPTPPSIRSARPPPRQPPPGARVRRSLRPGSELVRFVDVHVHVCHRPHGRRRRDRGVERHLDIVAVTSRQQVAMTDHRAGSTTPVGVDHDEPGRGQGQPGDSHAPAVTSLIVGGDRCRCQWSGGRQRRLVCRRFVVVAAGDQQADRKHWHGKHRHEFSAPHVVPFGEWSYTPFAQGGHPVHRSRDDHHGPTAGAPVGTDVRTPCSGALSQWSAARLSLSCGDRRRRVTIVHADRRAGQARMSGLRSGRAQRPVRT